MIPSPSRELRVFCLLVSICAVVLFASAGLWGWAAMYVALTAFWTVSIYGRPTLRKSDSDAV